MSGSYESANLQLPCELELANKDIFQLEALTVIAGIKYENDDEGDEKAHPRVSDLGTRRLLPRVRSYSFMLFSMRPRLGRPLGFPDVPLTNRVAIPASCNLSYLPTGDFDSEGRSIRYSSNESIMAAPKRLVLGELRNISNCHVGRSSK